MSAAGTTACNNNDPAEKDLGKLGPGDNAPTSTDTSQPDSGGGNEGDTGDAAAPETCGFVSQGLWVLCENEGENFSSVVQMPQATSLQDCADACLAEEQCTAVQDLFWLGVDDITCNLYVGPCTAPTADPFAEFGLIREYRKVCEQPLPQAAVTEFPVVSGTVIDAESGCRFRFEEMGCAPIASSDERPGGDNLDECLVACQEEPDCHGVRAAFGGSCSVLLAPCEPPAEFSPEHYFMLKECN